MSSLNIYQQKMEDGRRIWKRRREVYGRYQLRVFSCIDSVTTSYCLTIPAAYLELLTNSQRQHQHQHKPVLSSF